MADHLTQLQENLQQLAVQMFASLSYISEHHASAVIPGQQYLGRAGNEFDPKPMTNGVSHEAEEPAEPADPAQGDARPVDTPETFNAALQEMAKDLVAKEKQIEALITTLPGTDRSREQQEQRMQELNVQLEDMDRDLLEAANEKDVLLKKVEGAIWKISRY